MRSTMKKFVAHVKALPADNTGWRIQGLGFRFHVFRTEALHGLAFSGYGQFRAQSIAVFE